MLISVPADPAEAEGDGNGGISLYRVILVDDEAWTLAGLRETFRWQEKGFLLAGEFQSAREALSALMRDPVDAVLTDIRMPGLSGIDILQRLRDAGSDTEVVLVSGFSDFHHARQGIRWGAFDYLTKPVSREEADHLLDRLRDRLEDKARRSDLEALELLADTPGDIRRLFGDRGLPAPAEGFLCLLAETGPSEGALPAFHHGDLPMIRIRNGSHRSWFLANVPLDFLPKADFLESLAATQGIVRGGLSHGPFRAERLPEALRQAHLALEGRFVDPERRWTIHAYHSAELEQALAILAGAASGGDNESARDALRQVCDLFRTHGLGVEEAAVLWSRLAPGEACREDGNGSALAYGRHTERMAPELLPQRFRNFEDLLETLLGILSARNGPGAPSPAPYPEAPDSAGTPDEPGIDNQSFRNLLADMADRFPEPLQLRDLAARHHLSVSYCCSLFRRTLSKTFGEHLTDLRMACAASLLRTTRMTLAEISERAGYNDYYYFIRAFRKYYGITPCRYRKESA